ncbi:MAG: D-glycerate dehydrogenase [Caldilineaceae bacterium]|nr:D-glycerate dehydrogenase [Caldilineaceae bacterium]
MPKVVVTRRVPEEAIQRLQESCDLQYWDSEDAIPRQTLLEWVKGCDGIYLLLTEKVNDELLNAAGPQLKVVSTMSVGYDHIDVAACVRRNIAVGHTPDVLTKTTAELTVALLLATARRLSEGIDAVRNGEWSTWQPMWLTGQDLHESTVGIMGLGRIGAAVARMLSGFDCKLIYFDPYPNPKLAESLGVEYVSWEDLLSRSDFITTHTPLTNETRHLFNADAFRRMKKTAIFINTSRGGIVDQDALYNALVNGEILAAGLDVTTPEPLPADNPLVSLKNCVILPHIASASVATRRKMAVLAAENVLAGLAGAPLPSAVKL